MFVTKDYLIREIFCEIITFNSTYFQARIRKILHNYENKYFIT